MYKIIGNGLWALGWCFGQPRPIKFRVKVSTIIQIQKKDKITCLWQSYKISFMTLKTHIYGCYYLYSLVSSLLTIKRTHYQASRHMIYSLEKLYKFCKKYQSCKIHFLGSSLPQSKQKIQIHFWRLPEACAIITKPWNITKCLSTLHFYIL